MKHPKHTMLTHFRVADEEDLDTLSNFDDRTLAGLVGTSAPPLSDGVDNDNPYKALPVERWARAGSFRQRA